ncbi:GNAT family N-acetyltransferase [Streptomyces sp. NPDC050418]|uniref:GNAT family N-acetyltransferase n=1 Tax=Streptomyces sp. NPDC050418 TaxID=3365612 RepID=UPI0037B4DC90
MSAKENAMPYEPMPPLLTTERLILRSWEVSDAEEFCELLAERGAGRPEAEGIRTDIAEFLATTERTGIALLPVQRRAEGDFIGYCGVVIGRSTLEEPEIAYELLQRVHGQGYATEAAQAIVKAIAATGRKRLWATTRPTNLPSLRVLEKLGFERDRVTEDEKGEVVWLVRQFSLSGTLSPSGTFSPAGV